MNNFETQLEKSLSIPSGRVKDAMLYSLMAGGKRIRPTLFLKACEAYDIKENVYNIANAIEYIHTYSLIHDDLPAMDNDDYRRGKLTCHKKYDEATAILAGDGLLTEAFYLIATAPISDAHKTQVITLVSEYAGVRGMIKGQEIDMYSTNKDTIEEMDKLKTGCLLTLPLELACVLANDNRRDIWHEIGMLFGVIFQIQDDILDVTSSLEELGKQTNSDEKNNKNTYVSLYGLEVCEKMIEEKYSKIENLRKNFTEDFDAVFDYLFELGKRRN